MGSDTSPWATAKMTEPLLALMARAQALLSRPRVVKQIGRKTADKPEDMIA